MRPPGARGFRFFSLTAQKTQIGPKTPGSLRNKANPLKAFILSSSPCEATFKAPFLAAPSFRVPLLCRASEGNRVSDVGDDEPPWYPEGPGRRAVPWGRTRLFHVAKFTIYANTQPPTCIARRYIALYTQLSSTTGKTQSLSTSLHPRKWRTREPGF